MKKETAVHLTPPVSARDHVQGPAHAPLTLVEYGDYECPHCARAQPTVKAVQRRLGSELRFVFRNFPLVTLHPHAEAAAEIAEAAAPEGKFWPMHDLLFENQRALAIDDLIGYAADLGLDVERVTSELERRVYSARVEEDVAGALQAGVHGTPTFFVNGVRFDGDWDEESLLAALASGAAKEIA